MFSGACDMVAMPAHAFNRPLGVPPSSATLSLVAGGIEIDSRALFNRHVRDEVMSFAREMESALHENDHKRQWPLLQQRYLESKLREKMRQYDETHEVIAKREILVHVANYAMMLWDNWGGPDANLTYADELEQQATWLQREADELRARGDPIGTQLSNASKTEQTADNGEACASTAERGEGEQARVRIHSNPSTVAYHQCVARATPDESRILERAREIRALENGVSGVHADGARQAGDEQVESGEQTSACVRAREEREMLGACQCGCGVSIAECERERVRGVRAARADARLRQKAHGQTSTTIDELLEYEKNAKTAKRDTN